MMRRERRQAEREAEKERREYERQKSQEEECLIREDERLRKLRAENTEQFAARESERRQSSALTGEKITVLTAAAERLTVPLANVEFDSKEGKHVELVGVLDKLPVDCLLGRSSFGKTLSRQNILDQWKENVSAADASGQEAFVVTRRQRALEEAQLRADELSDRESSIAVKSLSKKETKREGAEEGDLQTLFEGKILEEK
ncbi:unnamed protein product, partial [Porites lobata]